MRYTITVFAENKPGVLYRLSGILLRRKINVETITAAELPGKGLTRITIVLETEQSLVEKVVQQINKIIEVHKVSFYRDNELVFNELALLKISLTSKSQKDHVKKILEKYSARVVFENKESIVLEVMGTEEQVRNIMNDFPALTLDDIAISGRIAVTKEAESVKREA